jgi:hypothetical protein
MIVRLAVAMFLAGAVHAVPALADEAPISGP